MSMSTEEVQALPAAVPMKQVGEALGISPDLTYAAANSGDIEVIRVGRRMLMPKTALLKMLGMSGSVVSSPVTPPEAPTVSPS